MKRIDKGKTSLVEFLASIKFARQERGSGDAEQLTSFASFNPQVRGRKSSTEDYQLIRSAN